MAENNLVVFVGLSIYYFYPGVLHAISTLVVTPVKIVMLNALALSTRKTLRLKRLFFCTLNNEKYEMIQTN